MIIKLHNYEAIRDGEIEIDGLTGIRGKNNQGKSSIQRAINDFINNTFSSSSVSWETDEGYIDIDGNRLYRNSKTSKFVSATGEIIEKMAGKKIINLIHLDDFITISNAKITNFDPQFVWNKQLPVPLGLSATQMYNLFTMMFDMERINNIFNKIRTDIKTEDSKMKKLMDKKDLLQGQKSNLFIIEDLDSLSIYIDIIELLALQSSVKEVVTNDLEIYKKDIVLLQDISILKQLNEKLSIDTIIADLKQCIRNAEILAFICLTKHLESISISIENYKATQNQLAEEKKQFNVCPLCGQSM